MLSSDARQSWRFVALLATLISAVGAEPVFPPKLAQAINRVSIKRTGGDAWQQARPELPLNMGDSIRTGERSRAELKVTAVSDLQIGPSSTVTLRRSSRSSSRPVIELSNGLLFLFSRSKSHEFEVTTPTAVASPVGTEFVVQVGSGGETEVAAVDGAVELRNSVGSVMLQRGERGVAENGHVPRKTARIDAADAIQWTLYYPAVINPSEIELDATERILLSASFSAYRQGDIMEALEKYPGQHEPVSPGGALYRATVLLAAGEVDTARSALGRVPADTAGRCALEKMLAAIWHRPPACAAQPRTASEWLAESYYQQSAHQLDLARDAASRATELAGDFGAAWIRLAELEFSFGQAAEAAAALAHGLELAPRNAQAFVLHGFLLSAENRVTESRRAFDEAIRLDGALGNAWLGRGLLRFHQGEADAGRNDLQTAAALESNRSILRSYLGKAFSQQGQVAEARLELDRARDLDPADPTPWFYSAIHDQQAFRYNAAIGNLHEAQRLSSNRRVYRSTLLLDEDRAVRSANLAAIYQHDGMNDVAVREATRAVEADYANSSAHLLLANSFNVWRDPARVSLRYETAWFNEQLLAFLLAPVGGGPLSQYISQQEYSKMLTVDGSGWSSISEWREGSYFDHQTSIFDTHGRLSSGLDFGYYRNPGTRPNNATTRRELSWQFKYQATARDILYTFGNVQKQAGGDLLENYGNTPSSLSLRFTDTQAPGLLLFGWNHRWSPGTHTIVLLGRFEGQQALQALDTTQLIVQRDAASLEPGFVRRAANGSMEYTAPELRAGSSPPVSSGLDGSLRVSSDFQRLIAPFLGQGPVLATYEEKFDFDTRQDLAVNSAEIQHLVRTRFGTVMIGGRTQHGDFRTDAKLDLSNPANLALFTAPAALQHASTRSSRESLYTYDYFHLKPSITLIGGLTWDRLNHPENFRNPPVSDRQVESEKTSAKLGFTVSPSSAVTVRGVYAEGLGGVTADESVRLEPAQLAGFNQAFRTIISESIVGSVESPHYRNGGVSIEGKLRSRTWWGASYNVLEEDVARTVGAFDLFSTPIFPNGAVILPSGRHERLAYRENVFLMTADQLIGDEFAFGGSYRDTRATLRRIADGIPISVNASADRTDQAQLHEINLRVIWNSPSGWFVRWEAIGVKQELELALGGQRQAAPPGDRCLQWNLQAGVRFRRNQWEIRWGILNVSNMDYHLSPLTYTQELPRHRTLFGRLRIGF